MTNEERHIAVLNRLLESMNVFDSIQPTEERKKAIKAAIQALSPSRVKNELNFELNELESCDDAISREDATAEFIKWQNEVVYAFGRDYLGVRIIQSAIDIIRQLPSVTHKYGKWIAQDVHNCHTDFKCSECGYIHNFMHLYGEPSADYTYCPNCGARMVEPQESEEQE